MPSAPSDNRPPNAGRSDFAGKVALVTGAGSGIGLSVARALLAAEARVLLFGRTLSKLEQARAGTPDDRSRAVSGSHEIVADARGAVDECLRAYGRLDILVNCAGEFLGSTLADTSGEDWERMLRTNLTGPYVMTREALPALRKNGGAVINVASTLGLRPVGGVAAYAAAKAGLIQLTRSVALEEAGRQVRACVVCPGVVDTPIHALRSGGDSSKNAQFLETAGKMHPLGRVGRPEEVADMILFLASERSAWTTGAVITIDGGIAI